MIPRRALMGRALLGGAATLVASPAAAQKYYPMGTKQQALSFKGVGGVTLKGTLLLPTISELQKVPGVVLHPGSGPSDRDGNNALVPVKIDLLKLIAELLADNGIASLRYDKRGVAASGQQTPTSLDGQERFFAWDNYVGDVMAAHAELLRHDEIKPYATALLGHSEGGLLSLAAAAAMGKRAPYAVVIAGTPGRPLIDIVREQIARGLPQLSAEAERVMKATLATGHVPDDTAAELRLVFPAYGGPFFRGALTFDPAQAVLAFDSPCLLLHGGADAQIVPMAEIQPLVDALARRDKPGEVLVAAGVSHNLKPVTNATDPGFVGPIAPAIRDKLASWLRHVLGA
ncbi:MAG: alpha/beta fold hydrolase [Reyranella sp.]|uniref:alpha/beta hydrolase family protein n=1 Tax=Reyranella sp. TaxID=1929291 RepID=UPI001ACBC9E8|nr:alpha/beta fold hydrolase [Reyranella sp.]MBN9087757.1 alpha/beta fold hydrolase [Reyranella sp.]